MRKFYTVIVFTFLFPCCYAQVDTSFWFAAPDISSDFGYDQPISLVITAFQQPCVVTISIPANGAITPQTFALAANTTQSVDLSSWLSNLECGPGNVIQNKGLKIVSDNKISAYYSVNVGGPNPEFFSLKGINALGTSFFISSQYILNNSSDYTPLPFSSFNIVATEDNTQVTIYPTNDIIGHVAGSTFSITLNRGQTYAAIATSQLAADHLQGSSVSSNKPVAITLADDLLDGAAFSGICRDLAGDQTVPINVLGTEYVAIKSSLNFPYDKVYITATQDGTTVTQDGVLITTLNTSQSIELTISNPVTYIQTSNPAYAFQLSGWGCEAGEAILPKINCTGSPSVSVARTTTEAFVVCLLVKNGGQGNFLINGSSGIITAADFSVVPGTSGQWYYAKIDLPISNYPYGSVVKISNTTTLFQEGILAGTISGNGFGYFSNFNTLLANASAADTTICTGENLQLIADSIPSATYSWTGPGSFSSNIQNPVITNANAANTGNYILTVDVTDCGIFHDTVTVHVYSPTSSVINQSICEGQSFLGYNTSGTYADIFTNANGCDSTRTLNLTVISKTYSVIDQTICQGEIFLGYSATGTYHDTLVNANGCDSVRTLNLTVNPVSISTVNHSICQGQSFEGYTATGTYIDVFTNSYGCDSTRTLNLTVNLPTSSTVDQTICEGQNYDGHTATGTYIDILANSNNCDSTRTLHLVVKPRSYSFFNPVICQGQSYEGYTVSGNYIDTLIAINGCDSIRTIDLVVHPVVLTTISQSICVGSSFEGYTLGGTYTDTLQTTFGCDSIRILNLSIDQPPKPDLGPDKTICMGDHILLIPGTYSSYLWQDGSNQQTLNVATGGLYYVTVQNSCGTATDSANIDAEICEIIFPNAFTPNNDGNNDIFKALHVFAFQDYHLTIYNRWGEKVFETNDFLQGWGGTFKGIPADAGSYVWYCDYKTANVRGKLKGSVMLIRQ